VKYLKTIFKTKFLSQGKRVVFVLTVLSWAWTMRIIRNT